MKLIPILLLAAAPVFGQMVETFTNVQPGLVAFDYPTNDATPSTAMYLYSSTNITVPLSNWQTVAVITNLNQQGSSNAFVCPRHPPYEYFACRASNEYGLSEFSTVARSVRPRTDVQLRIAR